MATIYNTTWWGSPKEIGWGSIYYDLKELNTPLTDLTFDQAITDILLQDPDGDYNLVPYGRIQNWDVSQVTNMSALFKDRGVFDDDISNWDVSNVVDMKEMFYHVGGPLPDLTKWNTSSVRTMENMFNGATSFNETINSWRVSGVLNMNYMI